MQKMTLKANAKINLSLDVIRKRSDGYHEVRMVMQQINLFDLVTVSYNPEKTLNTLYGNGYGNGYGKSHDEKPSENLKINLTTNNLELPTGLDNIAYAAARLLAETYAEHGQLKAGNVDIHIEKGIPVAAGLAGGSTDAAAVLLALNGLWAKVCTMEELMILGKKLGADVPFCIMGNAASQKIMGTNNLGVGAIGKDLQDSGNGRLTCFATCALAEGIGEKLTPIIKPGGMPLSIFSECWIVLSKPPLGVSTAKVYGGLVLSDIDARPDTEELIQGLLEDDFNKISKNMINVLEKVTLEEYCIVMYTKNKMRDCDPMVTLMSGSGPTIFGLFVDKTSAERAYEAMKKVNADTYLVQTL